MLEIIVPEIEMFDERTSEFYKIPKTKLKLEHSLISLRKWEGIHHKAFLKKEDKTVDELLDYIRCMTLDKHVSPVVYFGIDDKTIEQIVNYINDPRTAATFNNRLIGASKSSGEYISAETIYYWMINLGIPCEFERWHLNQLLALIKFVSAKSGPEKKMPKKDAAAQRAALNRARRAKYKSKG